MGGVEVVARYKADRLSLDGNLCFQKVLTIQFLCKLCLI